MKKERGTNSRRKFKFVGNKRKIRKFVSRIVIFGFVIALIAAVGKFAAVRISDNKMSVNVKNALGQTQLTKPGNQLRRFPYPYDAMLAISSDADNDTVEKFEAYHRFLNTKEQTSYGIGLGLDISDSTWFYIGNDDNTPIDPEGHLVGDSMSYFQGLDPSRLKDAAKIVHYFKSGWIDSLHTFGDFSRKDKKVLFRRDLAAAAWEAMNENGIEPEIWINHGTSTNMQNFGSFNPKSSFYNYQNGDNPKSPYYHTDLSLSHGLRYVWNSQGMSQFAYDNPLFPINLRDGKKIWGFNRYTNDVEKGKIIWTWDPAKLSYQITSQRLQQLVRDRKYAIVAQHLGKDSIDFPFNTEDIQALQMLKSYQDNGNILVARTQRLLDYARMQQFVQYSSVQMDDKTYINISAIADPVLGTLTPKLDDIRGLTFYTENPENTTLLLNMNQISESEIQRNDFDRDNKKSIGVKWFKPDYTDYTKK